MENKSYFYKKHKKRDLVVPILVSFSIFLHDGKNKIKTKFVILLSCHILLDNSSNYKLKSIIVVIYYNNTIYIYLKLHLNNYKKIYKPIFFLYTTYISALTKLSFINVNFINRYFYYSLGSGFLRSVTVLLVCFCI